MIKKLQRLFSYLNKPERVAYLFILPSFLIFLFFIIAPLVGSLVIGTLNLNIFLKDISFAGLDNFEKILTDERFWNAIKNTFYFTFTEMPIQVISALLIAVFVSTNTFFRKMLRSVFLLPFVCSMTAVGIVWSILLDPVLGIYTYFLSCLGIHGAQFLKDPNLAMPIVVLITVWKNFGFSMVLLVSGIQSIPGTYYEAAEIDGASKRKQFTGITIPLLIPTLGFCIITNTIGSFQVFDQVFVMTQGGPLFRTETIVQYIYNVGFKLSPYDLGYASSMALILFLIIAAISLIMRDFLVKKEVSDV